MSDYDNKDMNLEDEENLEALDEGDENSSEMDSDRKKNLSFSFDKLLSSLNMNRKKRDEGGLLDSYPNEGPATDFTMETDQKKPEDDLDAEEVLDQIPLQQNSIPEPLVEQETEDISLENADEGEALIEESLVKEETVSEQSDLDYNKNIIEEQRPVDTLAEQIVTELPHQDSDSSYESMENTVEKTPTEAEKRAEPTLQTASIEKDKVEAEEIEDFSYSIYQKSDGAIDYDKLVGETKLMTIDSIYSCKKLPKHLNESVFIIELYGKTLPENLPIEVKRQSVLNILKVGSLDVDNLLQDAYNRIDLLNEVLEDVAQKTEEMNEKNLAEIADLNRKIEELRQTMANRAKYQQKQNTSIGYEIQRIVNIVEFINPR